MSIKINMTRIELHYIMTISCHQYNLIYIYSMNKFILILYNILDFITILHLYLNMCIKSFPSLFFNSECICTLVTKDNLNLYPTKLYKELQFDQFVMNSKNIHKDKSIKTFSKIQICIIIFVCPYLKY